MGLSAAVSGRVGEMLKARHDEITKRWVQLTQQSVRGRLTEAEIHQDLAELQQALQTALSAEGGVDLDGPGAAELRAILAELSRSRARRGFTPSETACAVFTLKEALIEAIDTSDTAALADLLEISRFIDELGLYTFETYSRAREEIIVEQGHQLLELSTPVIKLWEGVLAVPLVGTLDSARAQVVMEKLLESLVETASEFAIIDITGVPAVDTQVAQHLLKTAMAARLMGAECIVSGIRPQIAQTVVSLGIEFGDVVTKAGLADALRHALHSAGTDVVRRGARGAG